MVIKMSDDLSNYLLKARDSIQQTLYDLNFLYETCNDTAMKDVSAEMDRIIDALDEDKNYLHRALFGFNCGGIR